MGDDGAGRDAQVVGRKRVSQQDVEHKHLQGGNKELESKVIWKKRTEGMGQDDAGQDAQVAGRTRVDQQDVEHEDQRAGNTGGHMRSGGRCWRVRRTRKYIETLLWVRGSGKYLNTRYMAT